MSALPHRKSSFRRPLLLAATSLACLAAVACGSTDPGPPPVVDNGPASFEPPQAPLRRLRAAQYENAVGTIFGRAAKAAAEPPVDSELNGYTAIASAQLALNDDLVKQYERSAVAVAAAAMGNGDRIDELLGCTPSGADDAACLRGFVENAGRLVFRRPLTAAEHNDYLDVGLTAAEELADFYAGVEYVIVAMLQSPNFLFQVEVGEAIETEPGVRRLDPYETASRMSFFLLDTTPDAALLDAAAGGEFATKEGRREAAVSLLARSEARAALGNFFTEYLVLDDLETRGKDPELYGAWSQDLARSMREETMRLIADIVWDRDADIREIFTAIYTFVDERLATDIYGVTLSSDLPEGGWERIDLPPEQGRSGILAHPSIMTRQSHPESTSVTYRGLFNLERFLCRTMPPPPDDVVTELPPSSEAPTMRERLAAHLEEPVCAACHLASDPMGLALENYDGLGVYREKENGVVIDASADHTVTGEFVGAQGLGQALASLPDSTYCMVRNLYRHGLGRVENEGEIPLLQYLHGKLAKNGYRLQGLLADLVATEAFVTIEENENIAEHEASGAGKEVWP